MKAHFWLKFALSASIYIACKLLIQEKKLNKIKTEHIFLFCNSE